MKLNLNIMPHFKYFNVRQFFPNEKHIDRTFHESVLLLIYKGVLRFNEAGKDIELKPGEYYIQKSHQKQKGLFLSDSPNYYYIHFDGTFSEDGELPIRGNFDMEKMEPLINDLSNLALNATVVEKQKCFFAVLSELLTHHRTNNIVEKIRNYLQENYKKNIKIKDFENYVFLTKNQIINLFKETYGITPHKYITEMRLNDACELLLSTNRSLAVVANNVGYNDYSIFYKAFMKKYSISPQDYRKLSDKNRSVIIGKEPSK